MDELSMSGQARLAMAFGHFAQLVLVNLFAIASRCWAPAHSSLKDEQAGRSACHAQVQSRNV